MRRLRAILATSLLLSVGSAGTAQAVTLLAPPEGAATDSTPAFSWQLGSDEKTVMIEWSKDPSIGPTGEFSHSSTGGDQLNPDQTRYTVPAGWQLASGRWWWRVEARSADDYTSRPSAVRSFVVGDERPRVGKVSFDYLRCSRYVQVRFKHFDNSDKRARSTAEVFTRKRGGRRIARVPLGRTSKPGLGGAAEADAFRKPRRVRVGRRYFLRVVVRDSAGQVARSKRKRLRFRACR